MAFKDDCFALLNVAGVTAIAGAKLYPVIAPQGTAAPFVVWRRMGGDPLAVLSGAARTRQIVNVQVDCLAVDYDTAVTLDDAVRTAIHTGSAALKGTARPPVDLFEQEARLFRVVVEATLFHRST